MDQVLIVSDSHNDRDILLDLADRYRNQVKLMLHNGDYVLEAQDPLLTEYSFVRGNNDFEESAINDEAVYQIGVDRIYQTHGHLQNIYFGFESLMQTASNRSCNIITFGHTHQAYCQIQEGMLLLNPGSISYPRGNFRVKTYLILSLGMNQVEVQYYDRKHRALANLHFVFPRELLKKY